MKVDIERYSANRPTAHRLTEKYKDDIGRGIALIASATHCPAIVIAYYVGEIVGWDAVKPTIDSLVSFYGYTEIQNKPEGAP